MQSAYLECFAVESDGLLGEALFTLDIGEVVERVCVSRTQSQRRVVALLGILHVSLLLQRVRQVAIRVREVRLQLNRTSVRVDGEVNEPRTAARQQCRVTCVSTSSHS